MKTIKLNSLETHFRCQVRGFLYESDDPAEMGPDMIEVELANGILIDCGWYPDGDPNGAYEITMTKGMRDLIPPFCVDTIENASEMIQSLVAVVTGGGGVLPSIGQVNRNAMMGCQSAALVV
jgi:hypothetical protein